MRLNAPTKVAWVIALILGVLGLLGRFASIPIISEYNFWFMFAGWLLLVIATFAKNI